MALSVGKAAALPLLILNFAMYVIVLGLSGFFLNRAIGSGTFGGGFGGNAATPFLVVFSLIAGVVGIASIFTGLHHLKSWRSDSLAAASATAWISWLLLLLAFGLAWKEIRIGGRNAKHRRRLQRVLEAFVIILTFTQLLYLLLLHAGIAGRKYGPGYRDDHALGTTGTSKLPGSAATTTSPAAASAV